LLHLDYGTKSRYKINRNGPSIKRQRGKSGQFDICIWDPDFTEARQFKRTGGKGEQRTFAAVEICFNEHHKRFHWQVFWDLLKLSDPTNEVENGYILYFIQDYPYKKARFPKEGFSKKLNEMFDLENKIHIIYIENYKDENLLYMVSDTKLNNYSDAYN
jgi:hypothetical protein